MMFKQRAFAFLAAMLLFGGPQWAGAVCTPPTASCGGACAEGCTAVGYDPGFQLPSAVNDAIEFFELLDYDAFSALSEVEAAVDAEDYDLAMAEYLEYMRDRATKWATYGLTAPKYFFDAQSNPQQAVAGRAMNSDALETAEGYLNHDILLEGLGCEHGPSIDWTMSLNAGVPECYATHPDGPPTSQTGGQGSSYMLRLNSLAWAVDLGWAYLNS